MPKRRGRPRKVAWVKLIFEDEAKREAWLKSLGCPSELHPTAKYQEDALPATTLDPHGRKVRPTKVAFGESRDHTSVTQETDELLSLYNESADNAHIELSPAWQRYVEFMCIFAESLPTERKDLVKRGALLDARSRYWQPAPDIPAVLGTMADLRKRWECGEIWFRHKYTRRKQTIFIEEDPPGMPPDEPDDFDEADAEPSGHWDGLTWTPEPSKN